MIMTVLGYILWAIGFTLLGVALLMMWNKRP
jgi:hypothetical protein